MAASRERPPERLEAAGIEELEVAALGGEAGRRLLGEAEGAPIAPAVADELLALAQGNPLALLELPQALNRRAGRADGASEDAARGDALARAYRRRLESLDRDARKAVLLVVVSDDGALGPLLGALGADGGGQADLARAETAGFLVLDSERAFVRHPLLRPAVLELASPEERRAAHLALAGALDPERDAEPRAWHLAEAALGPDEAAAAALEQAAMRAAARTGYAAAASALEREAALSTAAPEEARRLLAAARLAFAAARIPWALEMLARAGVARHRRGRGRRDRPCSGHLPHVGRLGARSV